MPGQSRGTWNPTLSTHSRDCTRMSSVSKICERTRCVQLKACLALISNLSIDRIMQVFVLIGATSELGPFQELLRLGMHVAAIARPGLKYVLISAILR